MTMPGGCDSHMSAVKSTRRQMPDRPPTSNLTLVERLTTSSSKLPSPEPPEMTLTVGVPTMLHIVVALTNRRVQSF